MADKSINELPAATSIQPADLFVLQQQATNSARSLEGQVLVSWLTNYADGHGGIQSIAKTSTSGLVDTYTISYADGSTGTFTVTNGATGPTGAAAYVWIKWAAQEPTADNQMSNIPDAWIGIYTGTASSAPTSYTSYTWYQYKGDKGDTGTGITSVTQTGGTGAPGTTDTYTMYAGEDTVGTFDVYNGLNGTGAVNSVNNILPDGTGNVALSAGDIGIGYADFERASSGAGINASVSVPGLTAENSAIIAVLGYYQGLWYTSPTANPVNIANGIWNQQAYTSTDIVHLTIAQDSTTAFTKFRVVYVRFS